MTSVFDDMVSKISEEADIIMNYLECGGPENYGDYKRAAGEMLGLTKSIEIIKDMKRKLEKD